MRSIALVCLIVAVAFLLLLNGQTFTNSLIAIALASVASVLLFLASRSKRTLDAEAKSSNRRHLRWIAVFVLTLAAGLAIRLSAAYEKQENFNHRSQRTQRARAERLAVDTSAFKFTHPKLQVLFQILDRNAVRLSGKGWDLTPYREMLAKAGPNPIGYQAHWSEKHFSINNVHAFRSPNTYFQVSVRTWQPDVDPYLINRIEFKAYRFPENGWGAYLEMECRADSAEATIGEPEISGSLIEFRNNDKLDGMGISGFVIQGSKTYDELIFPYSLSGEKTREFGGDKLRAYLSSDESFREMTLELRDQWELEIRTNFEEKPLMGRPKNWDSRRGAPPKNPRYQATDEQKAEILESVLSEIEHERELIRQSYREMHATLAAVFPLLQSLEEARISPAEPD